MASYSTIRFEKHALPSIQESIQLGKRMLEQKLTVCKNRLTSFEKSKQMDTVTFLRLFEQGELGDHKEWIEWEHLASVASILQKKIEDLETVQYEP